MDMFSFIKNQIPENTVNYIWEYFNNIINTLIALKSHVYLLQQF